MGWFVIAHTTYFEGISTTQKKPAHLSKYSLDEDKQKIYGVTITADELWNMCVGKYKKSIDKSVRNGIIEEKIEVAVKDVYSIGKLDIDKYKCVTEDIVTNEVVITQKQVEHIKERHPNDYESFSSFFKEIVENPDYIIEANRPNMALVLKQIKLNNEKFKTVVRLTTSSDSPNYKNSIITFMKIDNKEWNRILKNKKTLYKSE